MKKLFLLITLTLALLCCSRDISPPVAKVIPDTTYVHDTVLVDDYSWLKDKTRSNQDVLDYLEAENKYTEAVLSSQKKLRKQLFAEMKARLQEDDISVPVKRDDYYYYSRIEKDQQYPFYCRKQGSLDAPEEIYLDVNELADGYKFYSTYGIAISPGHRYVSFAVDTTGNEIYNLKILDLENNVYLPDTVNEVDEAVWCNDNKTIFYSTQDEAGRTYKVYRHKLGSDTANDELIYTETDERFWVGVEKSKNNKFIILSTGSKTSSENYILGADDPDGNFTLIEKRQQDLEYYPYFTDNEVFIFTNWNAPNKKLMRTSLNKLQRKYWEEFIPHRDSVKITVEVFQHYIAVSERSNALEKLRIINLQTAESYYLKFNEPVYTFYTWSTTPFDSEILRYSYQSLQTPPSTYDYNMNSKERTLLKQQIVNGDFDIKNYNSERFFATARDGTKVPISILYRKNLFKQDGNSALYLTAYGAYGDSFDPYFSTSRLSLLDRGIAYGIAHVRGGSDMGEYWYEEGKLLNKKNTFTDFVDCSRYLIDNDYTSAGSLIIDGGSAGGLLIGAVLNMEPDLYLAAIADVPFVDIINTMLDPTLSAVISEYEEWGDPNSKEEFEYMLSYSPYNNIKAQNYPHILAVAGFYDSRVNYWEAAKWTAKLRATKTDGNYNLLYVNMNAGHAGSSGRYDYLEEVALVYAFIFNVLDIE